MDLYLTTLAIGGVGLATMAATGFMHGGHGEGGHGAGHGGGGHGGHSGHAGDLHAGHGGSDAHGGHGSHGNTHAHAEQASVTSTLLALMSPRVLFSAALGFGATGYVLRGPLGGGMFLLAAAVSGAVIFERAIVRPLWNTLFKFESRQALTLESAFGSDATAVTSFDVNGQGIVSIEIDGQVVQLLGTLQAADRALVARVPAGTKLRVEEIDSARNRCTVTML